MTDTPTGLDEAVRMFAGYIRGKNGFDELDFKEWLIDWHSKQVEEVLDRLWQNSEVMNDDVNPIYGVPLSAIEAERNKLKERDDE